MNALYWLILAVCAFGAVLIYARAEARKAERLAALKAELQERERADKIKNNVAHLSNNDVRERLRNVSGK